MERGLTEELVSIKKGEVSITNYLGNCDFSPARGRFSKITQQQ